MSSTTTNAFTVDLFEAFWANPDPNLIGPELFTDDVTGYWPGDDEPVRGFEQYRQRIADVLATVPGLHLDVAESATDGDVIFIRWVARGLGTSETNELSGVDRILLRDGKVCENRIYFDPARFERLLTQ